MLKKNLIVMILTVLMFSVVSFTAPGVAKADMGVLSEFMKVEANKYCKVYRDIDDSYSEVEYTPENSFVIVEDPSMYNNSESVIEEEINEPSTIAEPLFASEIRKSSSGSSIIMPSGIGQNFGFCHIFYYHMNYADGSFGTTANIFGGVKSQFQYAWSSDSTMQIIMDVINGTPNLVCGNQDPNRCTKTTTSSTAGERVRVVLHRGSAFSGGNYKNHDWVVISAYPY